MGWTARLASGCAALMAMSGAAAQPITTAPGCARPPTVAGAHQFYVDPQRGDKANDGSAAKPWRTLAEVLDPANHLVATQSHLRYEAGDKRLFEVNSDGPIKPGDAIYLMSGDHGSPALEGYFNKAFISVEAAPGQKPVVGPMRIAGASHWLFRGLKFQGVGAAASPHQPLIDIGGAGWSRPSDNIVFDANSVSTADDTKSWSDADWVEKPRDYGIVARAGCTTLTNNHLFNLRNAIGVMESASGANVQGNLIENFGNDGIDVAASEVTIRGNLIRNGRHSAAEPSHPDGIQGWAVAGATNRNVVIDSNTVINPKEVGDTLQGITIFDGKWDGLRVTNNVVVTNTWHGIALYGVTNALVINNTVAPSDPARHPTWILIHDSKDNTPSSNVIVRNNIAAQLLVFGSDLTVDHNMVQKMIEIPDQGKPKYYRKGRVGANNFVDPDIYYTLTQIDNDSGAYDLRPKPGSVLVRAGNAELAPAVDITGKARIAPIDIGAYAR